MSATLSYRFHRLFWSIYFVLTIFIFGLLFGYVLTLSVFFLALLLSPWPWIANKVRDFAEYTQCVSIRNLLRIQPWLRCETNLHGIRGFYEPFKTRRVVFVANHRSNLDTFLLISYIPGLRGLAKSTLFQNIFFAPYMRLIGFIPVNKGSLESLAQGLKQLKSKILLKNRSVLIFPETTRCERNFPSVHKFGAFFFAVAMESKAIIVPLSISGTDQLMGRGDLLINPFKPVKIRMLEPIQAEKFQDSNQLRDFVWNQIKAKHDEL